MPLQDNIGLFLFGSYFWDFRIWWKEDEHNVEVVKINAEKEKLKEIFLQNKNFSKT